MANPFGILGQTGPVETNRGIGYSPAAGPHDANGYMMGILGKYVPENLLEGSLAQRLLMGENIAKLYAPGAGAPRDPRIEAAVAQADMLGQQNMQKSGVQGGAGQQPMQQQMQGQWVDVTDPAGKPTGMVRNTMTGEVRNTQAQQFG
jgi:hypothetical protein